MKNDETIQYKIYYRALISLISTTSGFLILLCLVRAIIWKIEQNLKIPVKSVSISLALISATKNLNQESDFL